MRNKHVMLYDLNYLSKYLTPFDLRFEISNLDYPGIHVHIASNSLRGHDSLQGHGGLQMT